MSGLPTLLEKILGVRRALKNWSWSGLLVAVALADVPFGWNRRLQARNHVFKTRLGPRLRTNLANAAPVFQVFGGEYAMASNLQPEGVRTIVDVGAHVGSFTCWAATIFSEAQITAVEPEEGNLRDLRANLILNGIADRVNVIGAAVTAHVGTANLELSNHRNMSRVVRARTAETVAVASISLGSLLERNLVPKVDLLKLDCEGAEWEIIANLTDEQAEQIRTLVMECHLSSDHTVEEMIRLLTRKGFKPRVEEKGNSPLDEAFAIVFADRQ